jgi:hypothetical protein
MLPARRVRSVKIRSRLAERDNTRCCRRLLGPHGALLIDRIDAVMEQLSRCPRPQPGLGEREISCRTEAMPALAAVALITQQPTRIGGADNLQDQPASITVATWSLQQVANFLRRQFHGYAISPS